MSILFGNKNNQSNAAGGSSVSESERLRSSIELTKNRLKPHFLNSMLTSIYYLCETDAIQAQGVSTTLSAYLVNIVENFGSEELIPFSGELDLIKSYISLEHLRLEDRLNADFDVYISDFKIPPLTIEPLVENAVKHGIAGKHGAGTVTISTRRIADNGVQIKVIDDGVGFDMRNTDITQGDTQRVRERLQRLVGAEMTVSSEPGSGTEITITIKDPQN